MRSFRSNLSIKKPPLFQVFHCPLLLPRLGTRLHPAFLVYPSTWAQLLLVSWNSYPHPPASYFHDKNSYPHASASYFHVTSSFHPARNFLYGQTHVFA